MSHPVGGIRERLVLDSIYHTLYDSLEALGWFDSGRKHTAISFTGDATPQDTEIDLNTITLSDEDMDETDLELGSTSVETRWTMYVDFFAENNSIGKAVAGDIRDILGGRMSTIGRDDASIQVLDYRLATPTALFRVHIEDILQDKAHDFPKPWQKHWYTVRFVVYDAYDDEAVGSDDTVYSDTYSDTY